MENATGDALLTLPAALLAEIEAAAKAEDRESIDVLRDAVEQYVARRPKPSRKWSSPAEKALAFREWASSHPYTQPLSDEAIRRENLVREE